MRVSLLLKGQSSVASVSKLAGAFVLHGLSSGQATDLVRQLDLTDLNNVELTGTLADLNATFNKFGVVVQAYEEKVA